MPPNDDDDEIDCTQCGAPHARDVRCEDAARIERERVERVARQDDGYARSGQYIRCPWGWREDFHSDG